MKKILILSILLVGIASAQFDNVGTSAVNFLKIGVGSRAEGMGGAYTAQVADASALYWNPSGIAHLTSPQVQFSYFNWIADMKHSYIAAAFPAGKLGSFGVSLVYFDMGEMTKTTEFATDGEGTFTASDFSIGLGYGKKISDRFAVGVQAKIIKETISFSSATAFAVDAGSQYVTDFYGLRIGMAVTNFGTKMRLYGTDNKVDVKDEEFPGRPSVVAHLNTDDWSLPMAFRFGLSMTPVGKNGFIKQELAEVTVNWEYFDPRDYNPYYVLGGEVKILDAFYIRTGMQFKFMQFSDDLSDDTDAAAYQDAIDSDNGFGYVSNMAYGFGIDTEKLSFVPINFRVDYSISSLGLLGLVNRITFSLNF
ncbi:MAG: PorV/PorQ family protein [Fidelibacterota bacterium]